MKTRRHGRIRGGVKTPGIRSVECPNCKRRVRCRVQGVVTLVVPRHYTLWAHGTTRDTICPVKRITTNDDSVTRTP